MQGTGQTRALTIGVCEDHEGIRKVLLRALRQAGHEPVPAYNGREALALFTEADLDVIVMDIGLPDADGRDVVQALKAAGQTAPVLFLTALGAIHEKLQGFAVGADDYVVKPFDVKEVLARLDVLAQRGADRERGHRGLVLDPLTHSARAGGRGVLLTPTEFRMLAAIMARPDEVVRRRTVVAAAWPDGALVSENTIDSFIRRIRTKLAEIESPVAIETIRGVGFRLTDPGPGT